MEVEEEFAPTSRPTLRYSEPELAEQTQVSRKVRVATLLAFCATLTRDARTIEEVHGVETSRGRGLVWYPLPRPISFFGGGGGSKLPSKSGRAKRNEILCIFKFQIWPMLELNDDVHYTSGNTCISETVKEDRHWSQ